LPFFAIRPHSSEPGETDAPPSLSASSLRLPGLKNGSINLSGSKSLVIPGGTYYLKNLNLTGGSSVTFTGPAKVYITGSLTLTGHAITADDLPKNLQIFMLGAGQVSLTGSTALYADIYAPTSPVTITGTGDIYGSVIGKSITMTGNAQIHSDAKVKGTPKLVK